MLLSLSITNLAKKGKLVVVNLGEMAPQKHFLTEVAAIVV
jgi:hypothetical protein